MSSLLPALPALAALTRGDVFFVTEDPGVTPADKKINIEILFGNLPKLDDIVFQSEVDSAVFLQVFDTAGAVVLAVDTVNKRLGVGVLPTQALDVVGIGKFSSVVDCTSVRQVANPGNQFQFSASEVRMIVGNANLVNSKSTAVQINLTENDVDFEVHWDSGVALFMQGSTGDLGIGTVAMPSAGGGKVLAFGDNAADPTMAANTAGFYGKDVSGTVEAFAIDEAGNAAQLTSHPPDAPSAFYLPGDRLPPYIQKSFNIYIGILDWLRPDTSVHQYETFIAYNMRRSFVEGHPEFMVQYDWTEQQQIQVDRSEAVHDAWSSGDQKGPEPEIYIAQEPPQSLQKYGIALEN